MKFSLVMATRGRTQEIERFLTSLEAQSYRDFELVVVDQNPHDRLKSLLSPYRARFPISHLRSAPGVSRARNVGLRCVTGEVVGFPDDDCWYPRHLLEQAVQTLQKHSSIDGVTGRVVDESGATYARFDSSPGLLNRSNTWQRSVTFCTFLRAYVVEQVGNFDETLGPGAGTAWGGGEDIDYSLRAIEAGFAIYYDPDLVAFHPNPFRHGYEKMAERSYSYGRGIGRVWQRHRYPTWLVAYYLLRPVGGVLISLVMGQRDRANYHWSAFRGRLKGWRSSANEQPSPEA